ncbi:MAG: SDR family oxidoreductase [Woeseia sp.]
MTSSDFLGQSVVVTGAASGIGAAAAREFARMGAAVTIGDINLKNAEKVAESISARARPLDVTSRQDVVRFFDSLETSPGILVTAAGGAQRCHALDVDDALLFDTMQLNLGGFWRCTQEAARRAISENRSLAVVHVASSLYRGPAPQLSHFAAAKAASVAMLRCLAQELARYHIRVNGVVPGPVETPATNAVWESAPEIRESTRARIPMGRIGDTGDIVPGIVWLASPQANWVTGSILTIDGGLDVCP